MKMLLVGIVVIACAGIAAAQISQPAGTTYTIDTATTKASLQFSRGERRPTGTYIQNVTFTIGDIIITVDDATLVGNGEIQLGTNGRKRIPLK